MSASRDFDKRWHAGAHIRYEFDQLSAMYVVLARLERGEAGCDDEVEETVRLATLEALLVHARCVIEFLVGRPRRSGERARNRGDIPPTWFAPTWLTPAGVHQLDQWLPLLDSNLAHLSLRRIRIGELGDHDPIEWTSDMFRAVATELVRFVEQVDDVGWRESFGRAAQALVAAIELYPDLVSGS